MSTKFFYQNFSGGAGSLARLEKEVDAFLANNPSISIKHITQSGDDVVLYIIIWYEHED